MLRQATNTSKTANAVAVTNIVIIVANERTYITPYSNARNMLFPAPPRWGLPLVVLPWQIAPAYPIADG